MRTMHLALALSALALVACRGGGGGRVPDDASLGDVSVSDMCGTLEGLDDPAVFVGSCVGPADSAGDQGCTEFTTKPNAIGIGTPCIMAGCLMSTGNSWSTERCGPRFIQCYELSDPDGMRTVAYSTNPASCPMGP